jgi:uncharacterized repeat protein (TIGR04138 family)
MPPPNEPAKQTSAPKLAMDLGPYPQEAYEFVQRGLSYTVQKIHEAQTDPEASRHVSGQQLCEGLREFSLKQWGMLACVVLDRWGIHATVDFGRIVFALIEAGQMQKTPEDCIDDFRDVYDFKTSFGSDYRIPSAS